MRVEEEPTMKSRTILATLTAGGLLLATSGLAQTTPGGSSGATDPSKSGQSATQQSPSGSGAQPSTPSGSGSGTQPSMQSGSGQTGAGSSAQPSMQSGSGQAGAGSGAEQGMAMDKEKVRQLQEALKSKGHDPGPVDGIMGPKTQAALREYQKAENVQNRAEALQKLGVSQ
jgi:hypothetical protein